MRDQRKAKDRELEAARMAVIRKMAEVATLRNRLSVEDCQLAILQRDLDRLRDEREASHASS